MHSSHHQNVTGKASLLGTFLQVLLPCRITKAVHVHGICRPLSSKTDNSPNINCAMHSQLSFLQVLVCIRSLGHQVRLSTFDVQLDMY